MANDKFEAGPCTKCLVGVVERRWKARFPSSFESRRGTERFRLGGREEEGGRRVSGAKKEGWKRRASVNNVIRLARPVVGEPRDAHDPGSVWCIPFFFAARYHADSRDGDSRRANISNQCMQRSVGPLLLLSLVLGREREWRDTDWRRASRIHRYKDLRSHRPGGYSFLHRRPSATGGTADAVSGIIELSVMGAYRYRW